KWFECITVGMLDNPQTDLAALSTDQTSNGRTVVVKGSVSALFVGATTRWVLGIRVSAAFLARVLVQLVGLDHRIRQRRGGKGAPQEAPAPDAAIPAVGCGLCPTPAPDDWWASLAQSRATSRQRWSKASECL